MPKRSASPAKSRKRVHKGVNIFTLVPTDVISVLLLFFEFDEWELLFQCEIFITWNQAITHWLTQRKQPADFLSKQLEHVVEMNFKRLMEFLVVNYSPSLCHLPIKLAIGNQMPIRTACRLGRAEIVRSLLTKTGKGKTKVNPIVHQEMPLLDACTFGHTEIVRMLLDWQGDNGTRVDPVTGSHLRIACGKGHVGVVKVLLGHKGFRVDPRADGCHPLRIAAINDKVDVVEALFAWRSAYGKRISADEILYVLDQLSAYNNPPLSDKMCQLFTNHANKLARKE